MKVRYVLKFVRHDGHGTQWDEKRVLDNRDDTSILVAFREIMHLEEDFGLDIVHDHNSVRPRGHIQSSDSTKGRLSIIFELITCFEIDETLYELTEMEI